MIITSINIYNSKALPLRMGWVGLSTGEYEIEFNAEGLPSGVYFYRLTAGSYSSTKKLMLLK